MRYLIISDLHLGSGDSADLFLTDDNALKTHREFDANLMKWIDSIPHDRLIVNGDAFELWQNSKSKIKKAHPILYSLLNTGIILIGNHDYKIFGKSEYIITLDNGKTILVTHGFQNDPSMTSPLTRFGNWILGNIQRIIPGSFVWFENRFSSVDKGLVEHAYKYAKEKLKTYDYVVFGHTHIHEKKSFDTGNLNNINYYNCGSCKFGKTQGVLIDTEKNLIHLI
jgi:UDP-2,3-diacylglucosamine pyrophosphatase LpxH